MDKVKTALEIALERAKTIEVDEEKIMELDYLPRGRVLGAQFLSNKDFNLEKELDKFNLKARTYVVKGIEETFLGNLRLPRDEISMDTNRRCMEGLLTIKKNKAALKQVFKEIEMLFQYYARALEQAYVNLKEEYAARIAQAGRSLGKQVVPLRLPNVESLPEFQEEWARFREQLSAQYETLLEEKRQYIRSIR
ncbi:MAG: hypothetical protein L5656_06935 [Thermanaeromonas sp.]|uniref:hypothetical protein n=1 Tax=Thermanaeromonas sp. TaxID=2003697 RepID=UPI00243C2B43|nr:hypothetical protein [Thermanaeromonas sp.]MCG0278252.1 hypothetical protein [Thermanaeromonas sp.]